MVDSETAPILIAFAGGLLVGAFVKKIYNQWVFPCPMAASQENFFIIRYL